MYFILTIVIIVAGTATTSTTNYSNGVSCQRAGQLFLQQVNNMAINDNNIKGFYTCTNYMQ